ncbi:MAG: 2-dehydropantoate 2-reductase [Lachnospiraceae bacterium]|nr:2-dehydropantoate 2-reductase [Lachnospiraceae bacterium]
MKIAVLGMGGIGGVVGAVMARKFDDIYFIARGKTLEAIKDKGLILKSEVFGDFSVKPKLASDNPSEIGPVDVLIISTKGYGLESALKQYENIITEDTIVLPLLNGVAVSDDCEKILNKKAQYADGSIYIFANIVEPGSIVHVGKICKIVFGFKNGRDCEKARKLAEMLTSAGIATEFSNNVMVPVWDKYIMMCGNSCVFSYFECTAGEVRKSPEKYEFIKDVYTELSDIAKLKGINISKDIVEHHLNVFNNLPDSTITSLYRDLKDNNPNTEFESIIGKAARMADEVDIPAPCVKKAYEKYETR